MGGGIPLHGEVITTHSADHRVHLLPRSMVTTPLWFDMFKLQKHLFPMKPHLEIIGYSTPFTKA